MKIEPMKESEILAAKYRNDKDSEIEDTTPIKWDINLARAAQADALRQVIEELEKHIGERLINTKGFQSALSELEKEVKW